jgi:MarR family transcriptional regulator, organic hydroperoxide resistance regulator
MMLLWESDHQTVGQLGSRLALDSGTLSPLLKRLTAAGLVTRHRRIEDERSVSIALTDQGRALRDRAFAISESMIGTIGFDRGEFDDLMQRLRLLTDRVNKGEAFCA